jgi:hypothetical protein
MFEKDWRLLADLGTRPLHVDHSHHSCWCHHMLTLVSCSLQAADLAWFEAVHVILEIRLQIFWLCS